MEHVRNITREFETGKHAVMHVEGRSGSVEVEGYEGTSVRVDATVRIWSDLSVEADDAASTVAQNMEQDGHRVIVRAPSLPQSHVGWNVLLGARGSRVDYAIRVPKGSAVRVLSRSGRISIHRIDGRVHCEAMSGKTQVEEITGDVTASSRSGSVSIEQVRGNVTADVRSGKVRVHHVTGDVVIEARSGAVEVAETGASLRVIARSGAVMIDDAEGPVHARARCGALRYRGRVKADFDIEVHTGNIQFSVDPEYPFFIDAESHIGPVTSSLPRRGGEPPPAGGPKVRLRARTGPIRISRLD
ncbi:MAG: DUF4097 family beta strand repeat-containing protein [Dehalococcoidia bacterium]